MTIESIWKKEHAIRRKEDKRRERANRNWEIHEEIIKGVFDSFAATARADNVLILVDSAPDNRKIEEWRLGEFPRGVSSITLRFGFVPTGEGMLVRTEESANETRYLEHGARLIVHHSQSLGAVQVFFDPPWLSDQESTKGESLLAYHTFNTDTLTRDWANRIIKRFLIFNRVESSILRPTALDSARVRLWRFLDIRNRRGYLDKLQHIFTPWELVVFAVIIYIVSMMLGATGQ